MSVSVPASYLYNQNDKFEIFLRRHLTQEQFERIRGYERCIVCDGKKLNRAFCYYVVSDKSIFITENPPQSILLSILLRSLTKCEIMDDFPGFFDANLTHTSTHVQIKYRTAPSDKNEAAEITTEAEKPNDETNCEPEEKPKVQNKRSIGSLLSKIKSSKTKKESKSISGQPEAKVDDEKKTPDKDSGKKKRSRRKAKADYDDEGILDIHFLTNITPLCLLTKLSWRNCMITSTLEKDRLFSEVVAQSRHDMAKIKRTDSIFHHFDANMRQLVSLIKAADLDEYCQLAAQFDSIAFHSYAFRRLFWKWPQHIISLTKCAETFAKEIGIGMVDDSKKPNLFQRAWAKQTLHLQIEGLALTLQLIATFFSETEILKSRTTILSERENNVVVSLAVIICDAISYASKRLLLNKRRDRELNSTEELLEDLLTAAAALVYEIVLSGQALVHHSESAHFYNVCYLVSLFEASANSNYVVCSLASDAINSVAFIPTPKPMKDADLAGFSPQSTAAPSVMSPGRAVQTYRELFTLDVFTKYSPKLLGILRAKLSEEFKYFVNMDTAAACVGTDYPIGPVLLQLLEEVRTRTLVKPTYEGKDGASS